MAQAQTAQNAPAVEDRMTFPPFPVPPPGVTIIPFKSYIESGIRMFPIDGDDTERDGLGIPTIALGHPHKSNRCKTETSRKRKQTAPKKVFPPGVKKEWYDEWEEGEDLRIGGPYNPLISPIDRLYEAANQFKRGRTWPYGPPNRSLQSLWDQLSLYLGLRSNTPVWHRTDKEKKDEDEDDGPGSDDEDVLDKESTEVIGTNKPNKHQQSRGPIPRPPYALYGKDPIPVNSDAEVTDLVEKENVRREEAMIEFLNDPEEKIKIFLSSYMRKQGLIWYDRNLIYFPKLVNFFLNFVLRSRVFINEPDIEKRFKKAIEVATLAEKELILTSKTSKELPDKFGRAMKECWGQKADGYKMIEPVSHPVYPTRGADPTESVVAIEDSTDGEPQAKRQKTDNDDSKEAAKATVEKLRKELGKDDIELLNVEDLVKEGQIRETLSDNLDASTSANVEGAGWGNTADNSTSEWGNPGWGDSSAGLQPSEEFLASMDAEKEENEWTNPSMAAWDPPEVHSLLPLLGPSAFPLTHTSGIVEWSLRRIKSFTPPPDPVTIPKSALSSEPNAEAVEVELERRFAKLVMEPWIGWDKANDELPHLTNPRILETSKGPVAGIVQEDGQVKPDPSGAAATAPANGPQPHDPSKAEITVLVDPDILPAFCEGLGIGATWVQLAREQDFATDGKKKKKSKKNTRLWYAEEVLMVIPSFHT